MKTSIIISSCDLYSDCWLPMIHSFQKFWKDCPYEICIISNYEQLNEDGVRFIPVGEHKGFGSNMKKALELIDSDYIIFFLEDFFLKEKVNNFMINSHLIHCVKNSVDFLKIDSSDIIFRDELRINNSIYCLNPLDKKYSLNAAIAIWNKSALKSLSIEGFSAWDFERKGIDYIRKNNISIKSQTLFSSSFNGNTIKKIHPAGAVTKGKWTIEGVRFLKENNFNYLISKRKIEGKFSRYLTSFYSPNSFFWFPLGLILRVIQKLKINI